MKLKIVLWDGEPPNPRQLGDVICSHWIEAAEEDPQRCKSSKQPRRRKEEDSKQCSG